MTRAGPALALTLAIVAAPVTPQRLAVVVVRVIDQDGVPVRAAEVTLIHCAGPSITAANSLIPSLAPPPVPGNVDTDCNEQVRETDEAGEASFPSLRVGTTTVDPSARRFNYVLRAEKDGYIAAGEVITPHPARNDVDLVIFRAGSMPVELIERAQAAADDGDFADAAAAMRELIDRAFESYTAGPPPEALVGWLRYLVFVQVQGASDSGARETLSELLELDPYDVFAIRTLGVLEVRAQDWPAARHQFDLYLLLEPDDADAWLMMGGLLIELGELDEAFEHLEHALELDPGNPRIYRVLGLGQVAARDYPAAIANLERYLELAGDPPDASQIRATIESIRR